MSEQELLLRIREIFAEELEKNDVKGLAYMVRQGTDTSLAGTAAIRAMQRLAKEIEDGREGQKGTSET